MFSKFLSFFYQKPQVLAATFRIDRFIDGTSENNTKPIYVGITSGGQQGIRIGEVGEHINVLKSLEKKENELLYTFENNIALSLTRKEDNTIEYDINSPNHKQTGYFRGGYKTISMASDELDEIQGLVSPRSELG
jgi:hypothetical protein